MSRLERLRKLSERQREELAALVIRPERAGDAAAVRALHVQAFGASELGYHGEADIVERLRATCSGACVSLVAIAGGTIVGHILFSPATIDDGGDGGGGGDGARRRAGMGLAPMAVSPAYQRLGIGARMIADGVAMLRANGCPFVIVLGHPAYYARFGFERASELGVICELDIPAEAFMVRVLDDTERPHLRGIARYRPELTA